MRRWAIPVTEISVSVIEISVTGMKIFPYEHFIPVTGMKKNSNTVIHFLIEWTILVYYSSFFWIS